MPVLSLPADQQFFADLLSGLVLNPQRLGHVWFAGAPKMAAGELFIDFPRLEVVLRGEYGNRLEPDQRRIGQGEMLFIPPRAANAPCFDKPVMVLSLVFATAWLGLAFYDNRSGITPVPLRKIELPHLQRGEGEAILTALTLLSRSPQDQDIIRPLTLSLLHLCRKVVNTEPERTQSRPAFLYQSICNWLQENYAEPLTRTSVAEFFTITPNHLSRLFSEQGTMSFVDYLRWVRMAKARIMLQKYSFTVGEVARRCGYPDSDYFCRLFRRQFGLTPGEYQARFQ
ncbi:AraC family transcriptional regulator [Superficieibacter electus]|uniref:AraC family transcriptional regulator n=1 Tax=Superficieibacter electus TaxID=2022662 RepID=A0A2P5GR12_9ENTR|nr:AraC family transcriptional regulator [Superficieibacter electus]POP43475.1 AraC family transcriptional regulator [Superficieibacter electus]POP48990.1 AraC family transcriptional regulator [Superficieibacter electus]